VQATSASVVKPFVAPNLATGPQTFSQLGVTGNTTFAGQTALKLPLNETQLGGVVSGLNVNLQASYTPVEPLAKASAQVSVNGVVLDSVALDSSGNLNMPFTVPAALISRTTTIILTIDYFPVGFTCSSSRSMTFVISPQSTVTPTIVSGGVGGFPQLPQSLVPSFQVSFDENGWQQLNAAVSTICGLQRISSVPIHPEVVPLATALENSLPLVVVARAQNIQGDFSAPLEYRGDALYSVASESGGQVRMTVPVAAMEVFNDSKRNRTVLEVMTTGSWSLTGNLFSWLGDTSTRWAGLTGDVLVTAQTGNPVNLTVAAGGASVFAAPTTNNTYLYLGALVLFVLLVAMLVVWATVRYRRRDPSSQ
jgi:hypothetical protein